RAWRLLSEPCRGRVIAAVPLPDHRSLYLEYEGPVGGGRGRVVRWDAGSFVWEAAGGDEVRVRMEGGRITGTVTMWRTDGGWTWEWLERAGRAAGGSGGGVGGGEGGTAGGAVGSAVGRLAMTNRPGCTSRRRSWNVGRAWLAWSLSRAIGWPPWRNQVTS